MAQSLSEAEAFLSSWNFSNARITAAIFPSFVHIPMAQGKAPKTLLLGAQDCSPETKGAFTGEVSALMLKELGISYSLVGHSERRKRFSETNGLLRQKIDRLIECQIKPVVCVGETETQRDSGELWKVLEYQLEILNGLSSDLLIAYEPVWAIGTGKIATSKEILEAHRFIKEKTASRFPVLYGGSVSAKSALEILNLDNVDGVLVGGASLKLDEFSLIAKAAEGR